MADYGEFYIEKPKVLPPPGPGTKVIELMREIEALKAELEEAKAVGSLRSMASELESGPIVEQTGDRIRTLTNFKIHVRGYTFKVDLESTYARDDTWMVSCSYGDYKFSTRNHLLIDSECEAAADFFDALRALREQETKLKTDFQDSRNKAEISWDGLVW